jgi:hypothetical protein
MRFFIGSPYPIERLNKPGQARYSNKDTIRREIWNNPIPELFHFSLRRQTQLFLEALANNGFAGG